MYDTPDARWAAAGIKLVSRKEKAGPAEMETGGG